MGEVLRILRQKIGYTSLETFANDIGMDSALYGRYERGENIKIISLARLLSHFNLEIDEYFKQVKKIIRKKKT
ncbi:MAG: helix-turn-helix domain-containing protein [Bacteroidetes bacterium]|nr:helix-turn-helix domain-containing protein [Bacteroidota bacterium]